MVYTMVEMAKVHNLNIYGCLKFLLEHRPTKEITDEQLAELAPWSENSSLSKIAYEL
jgi:transposase